MKKVSVIGSSILAFIAVLTVFFVNSCTTDACKDVTCLNGGTCIDGTCECADGYEGTDCSTEQRAKFAGTYTMSGTVSCPISGDGTITNLPLTISNSSAGVTKVVILFAGTTFTAAISGTSLTLDSQTIQGFDYTGSGSLSGNNLSLTINEFDPNLSETCVYSMTGPKQ